MGEAGPSPALSRNGRVEEQAHNLPAAKPDYPPHGIAPGFPSDRRERSAVASPAHHLSPSVEANGKGFFVLGFPVEKHKTGVRQEEFRR